MRASTCATTSGPEAEAAAKAALAINPTTSAQDELERLGCSTLRRLKVRADETPPHRCQTYCGTRSCYLERAIRVRGPTADITLH